jgi:hypothetical protein
MNVSAVTKCAADGFRDTCLTNGCLQNDHPLINFQCYEAELDETFRRQSSSLALRCGCTTETKMESVAWKRSTSPANELNTTVSAAKAVVTIFWDIHGTVVDLTPRDATVIAVACRATLQRLNEAISTAEAWPACLRCACYCMIRLGRVVFTQPLHCWTRGFGNMPPPPPQYSLDFGLPCVWQSEKKIQGRRFISDDTVKTETQKWLRE